jgi:uncharacterized membrane protein YhhN
LQSIALKIQLDSLNSSFINEDSRQLIGFFFLKFRFIIARFKPMNFRIHSLLYFSVGLVYIALETVSATYPGIAVKALIIPVLAWLYIRFVREGWNPFHRMILVALAFSWFGDVTLQLSQFREVFFLVGLAGFLLAQGIYLIAFFTTPGNGILLRRFYLVLPVLAYGAVILRLVWGGLGDMKLPVILYTLVILSMLAAAIDRKGKVNPDSFRLVLYGAVLFVISDSMIAINKFSQPFELARVAIMASYITAQFLIAIGCLRQFNLILKQ